MTLNFHFAQMKGMCLTRLCHWFFDRKKNQNSLAPDLSLSSGDGPGTGQSSGKHFWNDYLVKY